MQCEELQKKAVTLFSFLFNMLHKINWIKMAKLLQKNQAWKPNCIIQIFAKTCDFEVALRLEFVFFIATETL